MSFALHRFAPHVAAFLTCGTLLWPHAALADLPITCCNDPAKWRSDATFKLHTGSFPSGSVQKNDFIQAAEAWNAVDGTWFDWSYSTFSGSKNCPGCNGSEVAWVLRAPDDGVLGQTSVYVDPVACAWPACDESITDADIEFYVADKDGTSYAWTFGDPTTAYFQRWPLNVVDQQQTGDPSVAPSEPTYFQVVASHEIGHALNLGHVLNGAARMESHYPSGGWFHRTTPGSRVTPLAPDTAAMRALYGSTSTFDDVYLISWQHITSSNTDPQDGIDSFPTCTSSNISGDLLAYPANRIDRGRDRTQVRRGDLLDVRVCLGNKGASDVDAASLSGLEMYLSTDQIIGTTDLVSPTVVTWASGVFQAGKTVCRLHTFVIPSAAVSGKWYYVGTWLNRGSTTGSPLTNNITINNRRIFVE